VNASGNLDSAKSRGKIQNQFGRMFENLQLLGKQFYLCKQWRIYISKRSLALYNGRLKTESWILRERLISGWNRIVAMLKPTTFVRLRVYPDALTTLGILPRFLYRYIPS
jgi:hypothetical protein